MKKYLNIIVAGMLISLTSCADGYIDDITPIAQGTDALAPKIQITSPSGNLTIPFTDTKTNIKFEYNVSDDVEIASIDILLDGQKLNTYNSFKDYRVFIDSYAYNNLGLGDHTFTVNAKDLTGKSSTKSVTFNIDNKYTPLFGEKVFIPFFGGNTFTDIVAGKVPTVKGTPTTVATGYTGAAYHGATDSYISLPLSGLYSSNGISFTFWYKVDATPNRSGIITINDDDDNTNENRTGGLRLFREGGASSQTIKLNVGTGGGESWNDGGNITVDGKWVHVAVTVSPTESKIYFNGVLQRTAAYSTPFNFSTSNTIVIGSGAPSFTYWDHKSDLSLIDELRIYDKALNEDEVKNTMK